MKNQMAEWCYWYTIVSLDVNQDHDNQWGMQIFEY